MRKMLAVAVYLLKHEQQDYDPSNMTQSKVLEQKSALVPKGSPPG